MTSDEIEKKLLEMERRIAQIERRTFGFQVVAARKLAEGLALLQKHQLARDAKVGESLQKVLEELTDIRNRLSAVVGPRLTH